MAKGRIMRFISPIISGFVLFAFNSMAYEYPILPELISKEAQLEGSGQAYHIGRQQREVLLQTSEKAAAEADEIKKLETIPAEQRATEASLKAKIAELEALDKDQTLQNVEGPQNDYAQALSYYEKYFKFKSMEDDERQDQLAWVNDKLLKAVKGSKEEKDLKTWLDILTAQQSDQTRVETKQPEDGYGIQNEAVNNKGPEEIAAFDKLFDEDFRFFDFRKADPNSRGLKWDYEKNHVVNTKYWSFLSETYLPVLRKAYEEATKRLNGEARKLGVKESDFVELYKRVDWQDQTTIDEVKEIERDMKAIDGFLKTIDKFRKASAANKQLAAKRGALVDEIEKLKQKQPQLEEQRHTAEIKRNLYAYQSLSDAMKVAIQKIYDLVGGLKKPYTSPDVVEWRATFLTLMHALEEFELKMATQYRGRNPYSDWPQKKSVKAIVKYLSGEIANAFTGSQDRPSKKDLMRAYQYALNGESGVASAFISTLRDLKNAAWNKDVNGIKNFFSLETITKTLPQIDAFGLENPILAADLQRNLTHAYKVLMQDPKSGVLGEALASAKMVYDIKEVENMARDWFLGSSEYLYSSAKISKPIPNAVLVLVDLAEMAPYLAGAYVGGSGGGTVAGWMETLVKWVPVVGSYKPVKTIAKAAGGVAQVQLQKLAAASISRDHEILANSLRVAFQQFAGGKSPKDIALAVLQYQTMRKVIRFLGDVRVKGAANLLKEAASCVAKNKAGAAAGLAAGAAGGAVAGFAALTASSVVIPVLIPVVAAAGCAVGGVWASHKIKDLVIEGRKEARELKALSDQLKTVQLPTLGKKENEWIEKELPQILDKEIDMKALGAKAQRQGAKTDEDKQKILLDEVQRILEEKELKHIQAVAAKEPADTPDPELSRLSKKLEDISKRPNLADVEVEALVQEAVNIVQNSRMDDFETKIFTQLGDLKNAVREKKPNAKDILAAIQRDVKLLRVRQMEAGLVDAYEKTQD